MRSPNLILSVLLRFLYSFVIQTKFSFVYKTQPEEGLRCSFPRANLQSPSRQSWLIMLTTAINRQSHNQIWRPMSADTGLPITLPAYQNQLLWLLLTASLSRVSRHPLIARVVIIVVVLPIPFQDLGLCIAILRLPILALQRQLRRMT